MLIGPTDVWGRRSATAGGLLLVVEEGVLSVGGALSWFTPGPFYDEHVKPFVKAFQALRLTQPLV